jgi:putative phosphoesterase
MRIGLLSDTHRGDDQPVLWDEVARVFEGVDLVLHAGDITGGGVLDWLERFAPVHAARGNNDDYLDDARLSEVHELELLGWKLAMVHDMEPEERPIDVLVDRYLFGRRPDVIFTGHTHYARVVVRDGVVQSNSGSPTQPRLCSDRLGSVGLLELQPDYLEAWILSLGETPGLSNPTQPQSLRVDRAG